MKHKMVVPVLAAIALPLLLMGLSLDRTTGKLDVKVGESYYVCNCGEGCDCQTISSKPGKCSCDQDLVEAEVARVEEAKAFFKADGWEEERPFNTVGQYVCNCGPTCTCNTISQKPGTCSCGVELKKIGE